MAWLSILRGAVKVGTNILKSPATKKAVQTVIAKARPILAKGTAVATRAVKKAKSLVPVVAKRSAVVRSATPLRKAVVPTVKKAVAPASRMVRRAKAVVKKVVPAPVLKTAKYISDRPIRSTIGLMAGEMLYDKIADSSTPTTNNISAPIPGVPGGNVKNTMLPPAVVTRAVTPGIDSIIKSTKDVGIVSKMDLLKRGLMAGGLMYGGEQLAETLGVRGGAGFVGARETMAYGGEQVVKTWSANGTPFQKLASGHIVVTRKDGTVKKYKPYRPIVFGKQLDAKKLARVAKKHRSVYKELHKLFGRKTRIVRK